MTSVIDPEAQAFLTEVEEHYGGPIDYRTFCTFYADSTGIVREQGVILFEINNRFWFQDFRKQSSIFGFELPERRNAPKYVKFESGFAPEDVTGVRKVSKKAAQAFALGHRPHSKVKTMGFITSLFCQTATEIALRNGKTLFFQFMDRTVINKIAQASEIASSMETITNKGE